MATYTDNYQLTKPTYAEQADIGVINSNMNKIDEIMHSSQISLADAYDSTKTYAEGDVVMYELLMYKCISPTTGVWDASKWERTTASESGGGGSAELDILGEASGAVASFADGASAGLAKCIAEIVPKQAGSGTPSLDNVRAISGYTAVKVDVAGKNILPTSLATMKSINTAGTWNGNKYTISGVEYTVLTDEAGNVTGINANGLSSGNADLSIVSSFTAPEQCKMTGCPTGGGANKYQFYLSGNVGDYGSGANISNGATGRPYLRIFNGYNANNLMFYPMIRKATDSEGFEPYNGTTYTTPLGQTVYGGQLNVLTGELTIDKAIITLDGSESWNDNPTINGFTLYDKLYVTSSRANGISDRFKIITEYGSTEMGLILGLANKHIYASHVTDNLSGISSVSDWKTWLSNNNVNIVCEITPQTVQLTPQEVNSLLGQNNISADTGDVDIVYVKASAPIQPNPTGTPTATLKKLGIEGTVFEVEGGGGGSSLPFIYDSNEKVVGSWFGQTLYQKTLDLGSTMTFENRWKTVIPHYNEYALVMGGELLNTSGIGYTVDIACNDSTYIEIFASHQLQGRYLTFKYTKNTD